jgi:hypothetical protein
MITKELVDDIIGHERIHSEQSNRMGMINYKLPSPLNKKEYLSNKEEVMAFSWTIANEISKLSDDFESAKKRFMVGPLPMQSARLLMDIKRYCDKDIAKRYNKYIYQYLEQIFKKED